MVIRRFIIATALVCAAACQAVAQTGGPQNRVESFFGVGGSDHTGHDNPSFAIGARAEVQALDGVKLEGLFQASTARKTYVGDGTELRFAAGVRLDILRGRNWAWYTGLGYQVSRARTSQYTKLSAHMAFKTGLVYKERRGRLDASYAYLPRDRSINHSDVHHFDLKYDLPVKVKGFTPGAALSLAVMNYDQQPLTERQRGAGMWLTAFLARTF